MHKDEDLDCKVLSVMMRHFKKYLQIFFFWNLPPSLTTFEKPGLFRVKQRSSSLRSHGKYQHQKQFCTERKESLSVLLNYTVLNK